LEKCLYVLVIRDWMEGAGHLEAKCYLKGLAVNGEKSDGESRNKIKENKVLWQML
jgi:hypothetical protein